ncbi:MAG: hypothetical protein LBT47_00945 [Deltaproteobacteria bacterium]|nr:hypothetical protein [Deltaproteobacteria bacterium]
MVLSLIARWLRDWRPVGGMITKAIIGLAILTGQAFGAPSGTQPLRDKYQTQPFTVSGVTIPEVLLVVSKDLKMFQQGYPALVDLDGDGRVDTGFNPGVEYVGYFDSSACYAYKGSVTKGLNGQYMTGDKDGYFYRVGPAIEDQSPQQIQSSRPAGLKNYVVSPQSPFGVCYNPSTSQAVRASGQKTFSGNWLNFIATSRMDAIRKILYGGKRSVDTTTRTVLEPSFVPPDSTIWGTEIRSDDTWMEVTALSAYHDIRKFTPFEKPARGKAHFIGRGSDMGATNFHFPALRVSFDVDKSSFNLGGSDFVGVSVSVTPPYGRYWDWVLVNRPLPDDMVLKPQMRTKINVYNLHVEVCAPGRIGEGEGCMSFPGPTDSPSDDIFKPSGLLQRYGSGSNMMYFGLLTGNFGNSNLFEGGMIRNHMGPIIGLLPKTPKPDQFVPSVNEQTGQIYDKGLIKNLDHLMIAGRNPGLNPVLGYGSQNYVNTKSWSNPLGEMLYEGVRYLAGSDEPTRLYANDPDIDVANSTNNLLTALRYRAKAWKTGRPDILTSECAKPVILLISDISTDYDGNSVGSDLNRPLLAGTNLPSYLRPADVPQIFNMRTYLNTITRLEGLDSTGQTLYVYSQGATDTCMPKSLPSLYSVKGICPQNPSSEGTYSVVAAAYYAHIHDFNQSVDPNHTKTGVDIFSVSMSSAFPELSFPVLDSAGRAEQKITILPANFSSAVPGKTLGFLNYMVLEWETDRKGQPFHVVIKVNFSDNEKGDDWEGDGQVTYEIDLLTDASTPASMRGSTRVGIDSGELKNVVYYLFENPASAENSSDFIDIKPSQVRALRILSSWETSGTGRGMGMGYTISGTTRDGTYMDLTMNSPIAHRNLTPKGCPYVGALSVGAEGCGRVVSNLKKQSRVFAFKNSTSDVKTLPSTMYLAAKYGGFSDLNRNGVPDPGEWEGADGQPKNLFMAQKLAELPDQMERAFLAIARSISTGTSTSASINSVMGGGISIHTAYYPQYINPDNESERLNWIGTVYGLFVDKWGNLREDSNGNQRLEPATKDGQGDYILTFNSVNHPPSPGKQPPCFIDGVSISRCEDRYGTNNPVPLKGPSGKPDNIHQIKAVWDAGRWLAELDPNPLDPKLLTSSRLYQTPATTVGGRRLIYFTDPRDPKDLKLFNTSLSSMAVLSKYLIHDNFSDYLPIPAETAANSTSLSTRLVEYIQGAEVTGWRKRTVANPWGPTPSTVVWRMGDVINSKPIVVGPPAFNYDIIYGSSSYSEYRTAKGARRQVAYFGSNDGMLHAVNLGFYGSLAEGQVGYNLLGPNNEVRHELGSELWAYIPGSLLPHLKWLAAPDYSHSYMVDLKPLIADIKIAGKWRTILIGGLRLGGRPIENPSAKSLPVEERIIYSEVFCLDITDPEMPPVFLWRHSSEEMGLSVGMPSVVTSNEQWYVIIPSGPKTDSVDRTGAVVYGQKSPYDGYSEQRARLIVVNAETGSLYQTGDNLLVPASEGRSFFNDPFVPAALEPDRKNDLWNNHVVYYGLTISRQGGSCLDKGAVYRLRMVDKDNWSPLHPSQWKLERFFSPDRPVTGAVNATFDGYGNMWIVFATGRLWGLQDLSPCTSATNLPNCLANHEQYLYGIREQLDPDTGRMLFTDRTNEGQNLVDLSGVRVWSDGSISGTSDGSKTYAQLTGNIYSQGAPGYRRRLNLSQILGPGGERNFEMVFTQPKVVGLGNGQSVISFTSFEPNKATSFCGELGNSYMYLLDTFSGLASPALSQILTADNPKTNQNGAFEVTGGIHTGTQLNTEVTAQIGTDSIIFSTNSSDNSHFSLNIPTGDFFGNALVSWREAINTGFDMSQDSMTVDIDPNAEP